MSSVVATVRNLARDGSFTASDLQKTARAVAQNKGLTRTQLKSLKKVVTKIGNESVVNPVTFERLQNFYRQLAGRYSARDKRFLPNASLAEVKSLLDIRADYTKEPGKNTRKGEVDLADPRMPPRTLGASGVPLYEKVRFRGDVPDRPPRFTDVQEGWLDSCHFAAGTAGLFRFYGEWFYRNCFSREGNGVYAFRFFTRTANGYKSTWIRVDRDLYISKKKQEALFGKSGGSLKPQRMKLMFSLYEKAAAAFLGGSYAALDQGGNADKIVQHLMPCFGNSRDMSSFKDGDALFEAINELVGKKHLTFLQSFPDESARAALSKELGVITNHTYAVVGTLVKDGVRFVKLYNPWHAGDTKGPKKLNGKDDGISYLPVEDVRKVFIYLSSARPDTKHM